MVKFVSFQFDDGIYGVYEYAMPILNKIGNGATGTIAIVPEWLDTNKFSDKLTTKQVEKMRDMGWDMQCHTVRHKTLTKLNTKEEIHEQLQGIDDWFEAKGWDKPEQSYLPGAQINDEVETIVRQYRKYILNPAGGVQTGIPDLINLKIPYMIGWLDTQTIKDRDYVLNLIDEFYESDKEWLFLRGHNVQPDSSTYEYGTKLSYFEAFVKRIMSKENIRIVTVKQALNYFTQRNDREKLL